MDALEADRQAKAFINEVYRITNYIDYSRAHSDVKNAFGKAKYYLCVDCKNLARDWSYDNNDFEEFFSYENGCYYSNKLDHYVPRCSKCHKMYDDSWIFKSKVLLKNCHHNNYIRPIDANKYRFKFCYSCCMYRRYSDKRTV